MEWAEELKQLRREVDNLRLERTRRIEIEEGEHQQQLAQLKEVFEGLQIHASLEEMNRHLLDGKGEVTLFLPWESPPDDAPNPVADEEEDEEEPEEEVDVASAILGWEEDGEREVAVDLGLAENGVYLHVNGQDVRLTDDAFKKGLTRTFFEELEL